MANRSTTPFGALLRRYRLAALFTQEQLAARAQLSADTIRALESGKRRTPRPDSLHLLIEALSLSDTQREALLIAAAHPGTAAPTPGDQMSGAIMRDIFQGLPSGAALEAAQPGPLVGRESEIQTIRERLAHPDAGDEAHARLLTLTGPAGVGKTRLALAAAHQLAERFRDGVVLVDLAPVRDPALVLPTVAHAFGLADIGSRPLAERLRDYLRERSLLLTLDNFEHVLPAAGAFADLLANCPGLTILATSRIPLHLRWEWTLRVEPLPTPDLTVALPPTETLMAIPAVALFVARARAHQADFTISGTAASLVARLTSELDGLPLAIELAAARLDTLPLPVLVRRLGDRLRLLRWDAQDVPRRQHSLEAAVGWSYDLLSAQEQRLFRCLGVFVGQVSLPAISAVLVALAARGDTSGDAGHILEGLSSLAEKSLALPASGPGPSLQRAEPAESEEDADLDITFRMLETVREYAWERLAAAGELEAAQRAHAHYFQALAEHAGTYLRGPDQRIWFLRLEHEHDNLRAALRWCFTTADPLTDPPTDPLPDALVVAPNAPTEHEDALRLAASLAYFWWTRGHLVEGWRWLEEALRRAPESEPAIRLQALFGAGAMLSYQGAFDKAATVLDEALALAQARRQPVELAQAFTFAGLRTVYSGDVARSIPLLREGLRRGRTLDDHHLVGLTLMCLGGADFARGHLEEAASLYTESLARFELAGDGRFAGNLHIHLGWFAGRHGDLPEAVRRLRLGLEAGVAFEERRLLSVAAQIALSLPTATEEPADLSRRARLLGAVDALSEATGMTLLQTLLKSSMDGLRQQLGSETLQATYREGRSLPFMAVATLTHALLDDVAQNAAQAYRDAGASRSPTLESLKPRDQARTGGPLSARQREVLQLVAQGLSNKAIGERLYLSASTITYHLSAAFNKLGADTRAQAVATAAQRGLL